ncbi:MAG: hypothetical protein PHH37_09855 [Paludibacter sp.]|nr:hypothetical protein [Paludibacter sp.]
MRKDLFPILIFMALLVWGCKAKIADNNRTPLLEVEGKFLYQDDVDAIIPPNVNAKDSAEIAESFIKKWITDVLLYENAKRNITNQDEIDQLLEDYKKSLIIHQYQQKMIEERLPKEPGEEEMRAFYEQYRDELDLKENIIKGLLLVVPTKAPKLANVRSWVQSANTSALENIEKYSIRNAISYDYFGDEWKPFGEVLKKMPVQIEDPAAFVARNKFYETSDSTRHYFLRITSFKTIGQTEPYEMAKAKITNLILNKLKADFISNFEDELYHDAINNEMVTYFKQNKSNGD